MTEALLPASGAFDGKSHLLPVRVYYEDTDFTGVVYHANYLRYFERGRSEFLRLAGVSHTQLRAQDDPMAFVVARMEIDFKKPARIDDALIVRAGRRTDRHGGGDHRLHRAGWSTPSTAPRLDRGFGGLVLATNALVSP